MKRLGNATRGVFSAVLFSFVCAVMTGCGKDVIIAATPPAPSTIGTGNWLITGYYQAGASVRLYSFGGSLLNTGGHIAGTFHINQDCFDDGTVDVPYTGTVNETNNVAITSDPVNGQILTFYGTLSSDGSSITDGNFSVKGGCTDNVTSNTFSAGSRTEGTEAYRLPDLSGSWVTLANSYQITIKEQLTQASAADSHGNYALTGNVTVLGSPCFSQGTLQGGSFISGGLGREIILMNDGSLLSATIDSSYNGQIDTRPSLLLDPGIVSGGKCNGTIEVGLQ